jgi:hypothetical protein
MSIRIQLVGDRYTAAVTPPHGSTAWATTTDPLARTELIAKLREIGCHTTDISDAFYTADREWLSRDN